MENKNDMIEGSASNNKEVENCTSTPIWKKIITSIFNLIFGILSLGTFSFGIFSLTHSFNQSDILISVLLILATLFLIPRTNQIFKYLLKNSSNKTKKLFNIIKISILCIRSMLLTSLTVFLLNENGYLPLPPSKTNELLKMIETDKRSAELADLNMQQIKRYEKRINISKLAAHNIHYSYKRAKQHIANDEYRKAIDEIDQALTLFYADHFLRNLDTTRIKTTKLFKHIPPEEIFSLSQDYMKWVNKKKGSKIKLVSNITLAFKPNNPQILLLQANKLWDKSKYKEAQKVYSQYVKNMKLEGNEDNITENIKNIVNLKPGFNKNKMTLIYEWALQQVCCFSRKNVYKIADKKLGMYYCTLNYLYYRNSEFPKLFKLFIKNNNRNSISNSEIFKIVSGIDVYTSRYETFGSTVNSEFVIWAKDNLIPKPNSKIAGILCSDIYKHHFQDICRSYASIYLYLNKEEGKFESQINNFQEAIKNENFYGPSYYEMKFKNIYPNNTTYGHNLSMHIFGWWLRRGTDGSAIEFWKAIETILIDYDNLWLEKASKNAFSAMVVKRFDD